MTTNNIVITADPQITIIGDSAAVTAVVAINQLSGLPAFGTAALLNAGTAPNNAVELDSLSRLPAVDGSQLINLDPIQVNCGQLAFSSSTLLQFRPYKGGTITINGAQAQIPSGGITITNAGLAASTLYYVYAFMNSGVMALSITTTGHSTSSTPGNVGTEVLTGDDTHSLIGMVVTNSSTQFVDTPQNRQVRSWFNDDGVVGYVINSSNVTSLTATSFTEIDANCRATVLMWGNEQFESICSTESTSNTTGGVNEIVNWVNGGSLGQVAVANVPTSTYVVSLTCILGAASASIDAMSTFSIAYAVSTSSSGSWSGRAITIKTVRK